jgi:hypothetical protein
MSAASATLLAALTDEPTSTETLYARVGYPTLARIGLVPYDAFRAELARLAAHGLAQSGTADDGATTWRLPAPEAAAAERRGPEEPAG